MKKNKFVTLCVIAALPFATATAQTPGDLLNLSQYNYSFGTARSAALGGAFTSLGADLSSMNINPAGLGIYRGSEVGISPSLTWSNMESGFQGRSNDYSRTRFSLGNVGAALNLYQGTGALTSFTLGVGYTKLADFNTTSAAYGQGIGQSMTEVFAEDIRGVSESTLRMTPEDPISPFQSLAIGQWGGILAYNTYVLDPVGDNYYAPWNNLSKDARINPSLYNINKGSIGEYDISGGFNFQNILYLGFTVGIQDIYFRNENNYSETYSNNTLPLNRLNYIRTLRQDGTGVNFKFGAILRPVDNLRIGVAVHTPTYVSMNEEYTEYMSAEFNTQQNWQESPYAPNQYNINTPTRLLTGISFTLPGVGLITADYERVWYDNMKIRNMNGNNWEFEQDLNQDIKSFFQPANNFRVGVEATPLKNFYVRVGYANYGECIRTKDAFINQANVRSYENYSAGLGFRFQNFYLDATYIYTAYKYAPYQMFYFYDDKDKYTIQSGAVDTKQNRNTITLSAGLKFYTPSPLYDTPGTVRNAFRECFVSYLHQVVLDRIDDQVRRIPASGFSQDIRPMLIDSAFRNKQRIGDLVVRLAAADVQQNIGLALRQLLGTVVRNGRRRRLQVADQIEKKLLREEAPSLDDGLDGGHDILDIGVFQDESLDAERHHAEIVVLVAVHGQRDDLQAGPPSERLFGSRDAVHLGHLDIEEHDVGQASFQQFQ